LYDAATDLECLRVKGLTFIHLNIRSLLPKLNEIRTLTVNTKLAAICITETWLDIAFNARNDIGGDLETIWAEVYMPKTKPILS